MREARVTALLEIVQEAREIRDAAQAELLKAIRRAGEAVDARGRRLHSGTEIARAAQLSKQRVSQILTKGKDE